MINTSFLGAAEQMLLSHLEEVQSSRPENPSHLVHLIKISLSNHKHQILLSAGADTELWTATGCCGTALHLAAAIADKQVGDFRQSS